MTATGKRIIQVEVRGVSNGEHLEKLVMSTVAVKATEAELLKPSEAYIILLCVPDA